MESCSNFESKLAYFIGSKHCIGTNMGRTALFTVLQAAGISKDDEVILSGYACEVISKAICKVGARPVFVDINPDNYSMNIEHLNENISNKTKAIIAIHTFGYPEDLDGIKSVIGNKKIALIEDAAHSLGAYYGGRRVGGIGDVGIFSLSKNMTNIGGGAILTDDSVIASKIRMQMGRCKLSSGLIEQTYLGLVSCLDSYRVHSSSSQILMSFLEQLPLKLSSLTNDYEQSDKIPDTSYLSKIQSMIAGAQLNSVEEKNILRRKRCELLDTTTGCNNSRFIVDSRSVPTPLWYVLRMRESTDVDRMVNLCLSEGVYLTKFWQNTQNIIRHYGAADLVNVNDAFQKTLVFKLAPFLTRKQTKRVGSIVTERMGML